MYDTILSVVYVSVKVDISAWGMNIVWGYLWALLSSVTIFLWSYEVMCTQVCYNGHTLTAAHLLLRPTGYFPNNTSVNIGLTHSENKNTDCCNKTQWMSTK
jgi:hypothetical protein